MPGTSRSAPSILEAIREEFRQCSSGAESITPQELARHWHRLAEESQRRQGRPRPSARDMQAIALCVAQIMQETDLTKKGRIDLDEWVHYMLLINSGQAAAQINTLLKAALAKEPRLLQELQSTFEQMDTVRRGNVNVRSLVQMYGHKLSYILPKGVDEKSPDEFVDEVLQSMNLEGDERVTYPEFMAYCLGRQKHKVTLHIYDISNGLSEALSPWLVGQKLEGIWHSGICVFGKEYYFSKDTMFDEAGKTGFGRPTKVLDLGFTLWRQDELHNFVCKELKPIFHRNTYDVVVNNCNHFSDKLCEYLVGKSLPEEVHRQSEWLMRSRTIRAVRPLLNWWLRDNVVWRDTGTSLSSTVKPRLSEDFQDVGPGSFLKVHPNDGDEGRGRCVLGVVCQARSSQGDAIPLRFFDLRSGTASGCLGRIRTEAVPRSRLSLANLKETDCEAIYDAALAAMMGNTASPLENSQGSKSGWLSSLMTGPLPIRPVQLPEEAIDLPPLFDSLPAVENALEQLMERGYDIKVAKAALDYSDWNVEEALSLLLSNDNNCLRAIGHSLSENPPSRSNEPKFQTLDACLLCSCGYSKSTRIAS
mmetsp:Transcript_66115/g.158169  ORF Transcript_66115/g.158169 Transcript_66115/m.158169 type:complete len:589 (-) Transcript_66115:89-1855(-)